MLTPDHQLEQILRVLVERFGQARTLGEVYATTYGLRSYRQGSTLTLADIANHTGLPKQNLSRWLKVHVDTDHVVTEQSEEDGRLQELTVNQLEYACRHLAEIAAILGCEVDAAHEDRVAKAIRSDPQSN